MSQFKAGDRVVVDNRKLKSYGKAGTVLYEDTNITEILLDGDRIIFIKPENLRFENMKDQLSKGEAKMQSKPEKQYLAYLYLHDCDENPTEDGVLCDTGVDEWMLESPYTCFFGTIKEIKEWIESQYDDICGYENAFLIIDSKFYPMEKSVQVKGL